jgi:hypothetical protein
VLNATNVSDRELNNSHDPSSLLPSYEPLGLPPNQVNPLLPSETQVSIALPPLPLSGIVITKEAMLLALKHYVPHLSDITYLSNDSFILTIGGDALTQE